MTLYNDTRYSYYTILKRKLNQGNEMFTVLISKGRCYSGNASKGHLHTLREFEKFVNQQNEILNVDGNTISVDESIFDNFPQSRPSMCVPQGTPTRKGDRNDWIRKWYWEEKKDDYNRIKSEIDLKLSIIKKEIKPITSQEITFNEQQNSGDYNETPITEINLNNSCSECTETITSMPVPRHIYEQQEKEKIMKIGGIAAVGVGILLLYTRRNKK